MVSYPRALATSDFAEARDDWAVSCPNISSWETAGVLQNAGGQNISSIYALQTMAKNFTQLSPTDCIASYIDPLSATRALVIVASNVTSAQKNDSSLIFGWLNGWDTWNYASRWICLAYMDASYDKWCSQEWVSSFADSWIVIYGGPEAPKAVVGYCLVGEAGDNGQRCGFHYSSTVLPIVCLCTVFESLFVAWTWLRHREKTFITLGDAISDFLENPDDNTSRGSTVEDTNPRAEPRSFLTRRSPWTPYRRLSWFKAVSTPTWVISLVL